MRKIVLLGSFVSVGLLAFLPKAEAAWTIDCGVTVGSGVTGILTWIGCILTEAIVPILVTLAIIGFIWGIIEYYLNPDNEEKRKKGKSFILWGLISLFVIVSMWGIVGLFVTTFNLNYSASVIKVPVLPTTGP